MAVYNSAKNPMTELLNASPPDRVDRATHDPANGAESRDIAATLAEIREHRRASSPEDFVATLKSRFAGRIVGELVVPARPGRFAPLPVDLDPRIAAALASRGINSLYSHQAATWESVQAGHDAVVVTPTASGKSLCYNLPVLDRVLKDGETRALYLFPTKALAPGAALTVKD